ncbi:hypothetical protein [Aquitalea magnusonii]|uniref:Uncharacterized protein n=1 Tax=Aquitalea magnusonii TaxID=332411 RepID=A0A318JFN7_9NEIS|nr:hypothetical protein [Aquitalea magnusonii]PXX49028.1 hypothetical protein DFR38_10564 [Aquitalea magnusonii]
MMRWLAWKLKWAFARRELNRLHHLQSDLMLCRRWLAEFDDVALMLDVLAKHHGLPAGGFDDVPNISIQELRHKMRQLRTKEITRHD